MRGKVDTKTEVDRFNIFLDTLHMDTRTQMHQQSWVGCNMFIIRVVELEHPTFFFNIGVSHSILLYISYIYISSSVLQAQLPMDCSSRFSVVWFVVGLNLFASGGHIAPPKLPLLTNRPQTEKRMKTSDICFSRVQTPTIPHALHISPGRTWLASVSNAN